MTQMAASFFFFQVQKCFCDKEESLKSSDFFFSLFGVASCCNGAERRLDAPKNCLWVNFSLCCDQAIRTPESRRRTERTQSLLLHTADSIKYHSTPSSSSSSPPHSRQTLWTMSSRSSPPPAPPPPPVVSSGASADARCRRGDLWSKLSEPPRARAPVAQLNASAARPPDTRGRQRDQQHR